MNIENRSPPPARRFTVTGPLKIYIIEKLIGGTYEQKRDKDIQLYSAQMLL